MNDFIKRVESVKKQWLTKVEGVEEEVYGCEGTCNLSLVQVKLDKKPVGDLFGGSSQEAVFKIYSTMESKKSTFSKKEMGIKLTFIENEEGENYLLTLVVGEDSYTKGRTPNSFLGEMFELLEDVILVDDFKNVHKHIRAYGYKSAKIMETAHAEADYGKKVYSIVNGIYKRGLDNNVYLKAMLKKTRAQGGLNKTDLQAFYKWFIPAFDKWGQRNLTSNLSYLSFERVEKMAKTSEAGFKREGLPFEGVDSLMEYLYIVDVHQMFMNQQELRKECVAYKLTESQESYQNIINRAGMKNNSFSRKNVADFMQNPKLEKLSEKSFKEELKKINEEN